MLASLLVALAPTSATAQTVCLPAECCAEWCCPASCETPPRAQDDVWLISTRCLGWAVCGAEPRLSFLRYKQTGGWERTDLDAFLEADDPDVVTIFYVHGNRVEPNEASQIGWSMYHAMLDKTSDERPVRFVIWSWPAEEGGRPIRDARAKAQRTESESYYLGWLLSKMDPQVQVSLTGFSFGGRIVTGALQLTAGGSLAGLTLPGRGNPTRTPARVVLMSPALHNYWLEPGAYHGQALALVERMLIYYNSCDKVLKYYRFLDRCARAEALGSTGLYFNASVPIDQQDVCCTIGSQHSSRPYFCSTVLMRRASRYVRWEAIDSK